MSLSVATLYSLCIATVVIPFNNIVVGNGDKDSKIHSTLRGRVDELPTVTHRLVVLPEITRPNNSVKRRTPEKIDMSSFNDDTTLEEIEEFLEDGDDATSTVTKVATDDDDDGTEALLDEILDELAEAFVNVTNTTSDELFGNMMDTFFGPSDSNDNSTSTVSSLDDVFEEVRTSIFGVDDDDVSHANTTLPGEPEKHMESPIPAKTEEVVSTTHFEDEDTPPLPPNVTGSNTNDAKEMHVDDNDAIEPPILQTESPSMSPQRRPTLPPTESPTSKHIDDFDARDKETEKEDDDLYTETTYHNSNRPVGNGMLPNNKFTIALGTLAAIIGMIFTAWQMSDNPDGIYASLCRLTLTCIQLLCRIIQSPCRKCCGGGGSGGYRNHLAGTNGYHEPYGHLPVSTMDYGYKDPTLELT